jgi:cytochrome c-type biogenesis protein
MIVGMGVYGLSLVAGMLSTLSPCTLPLIPIILGTALTAHRWGPWALAAGLALAYALAGVFLATVGQMIGLDPVLFRYLAAGLLILFGLVLLSEQLQGYLAAALAGLSRSGQSWLERVATDSLAGQFLLGALLGIVWSPCVGPTLGAAIVLAGQGKDLVHVSVVMTLFGVGAALPLVGLGLMSHQAMQRFRSRLLVAGSFGKKLLGSVLVLVGLIVVTGMDKVFEAWILTHAPVWLSDLTISV